MTVEPVPASFAARSDVGRVRATNEDRFFAEPPLFAVADGMGGPSAGEVAATIAIATLERVAADRSGSDTSDEVLRQLLHQSNDEIRARAGADPALSGMGTTCTVAVIGDGSVRIAHVGDSRAYLLRDGQLSQLTADHSLVADMVRDGLIDEEEARVHRRRNVITRALGADQELLVDVLTVALEPADRLLLCTDGLTGQVADPAIADVLLTEPDPRRAVDRLIEVANAAGGQDNVTAVVVDPGGALREARQTASARTAESADVTAAPGGESAVRVGATREPGSSDRRRSARIAALLIVIVGLIALGIVLLGPLLTQSPTVR